MVGLQLSQSYPLQSDRVKGPLRGTPNLRTIFRFVYNFVTNRRDGLKQLFPLLLTSEETKQMVFNPLSFFHFWAAEL